MKVNMQRLNSRLSFQMKFFFFFKKWKTCYSERVNLQGLAERHKGWRMIENIKQQCFPSRWCGLWDCLSWRCSLVSKDSTLNYNDIQVSFSFFLSRNISFTQHYHSTKKHIENLFISFLRGFNKPSGGLPTEGISFPGTWWYTLHISHKRLAGFSTAFDQRSNRNKAWRVVSWTRQRKLARLSAHI